MSNGDEMMGTNGGADVVRLRVDGATAAVNTLRDQQTARGVSLVCPFPALEVQIPVQFGKGDGAMAQGTIHRIGVEDDPESGLPRLRLSVRTRETRSTVVAAPSKSLLDEASRITRKPDANAETDLDVLADASFEDLLLDCALDDGPLEPEQAPLELGDVRAGEPTERDIENVGTFAPDPEWAGCGEISLPESLSDRERSRRRRRLSGFAAWAFIFGVAAGGVYVLGKAKVVDFGSLRDAIAGFDLSKPAPAETRRLEPIAFVDTSAKSSVKAVAGETVGASTGWETHVDIAETAAAETTAVETYEPVADVEAPAVETTTAGEAAPSEAPTAEPTPSAEEVAQGEEEDTVVLPTRWPAEYANAYRLRNPNGVVVDVPGALVAREGWLEIGEHTMVRSVKAMQRETGARFVVYVNGELPRFMTAPKTNGIALKLVRDASADATRTQQVASLSK